MSIKSFKAPLFATLVFVLFNSPAVKNKRIFDGFCILNFVNLDWSEKHRCLGCTWQTSHVTSSKCHKSRISMARTRRRGTPLLFHQFSEVQMPRRSIDSYNASVFATTRRTQRRKRGISGCRWSLTLNTSVAPFDDNDQENHSSSRHCFRSSIGHSSAAKPPEFLVGFPIYRLVVMLWVCPWRIQFLSELLVIRPFTSDGVLLQCWPYIRGVVIPL